MGLFQDAAGVVPALLPGDPVGLVTRAAGSVDAVQATQASKPTLGRHPKGGRRNLLTWTEELTNAAWAKQDITVTGMTVMDTSATATPIIRSSVAASAGVYCLTLEARAIGPVLGGTLVFSMGGSIVATARINLLTGDVAGIRQDAGILLSCSAAAQGGGWFRIQAVVTNTAALAYWDFRLADSWPISNSAGVSYTGTATGGVELRNLQFEAGSGSTPYQKVTTALDVSQSGVPPVWHLWDDGGDSLPVTLPGGSYALAWVDSFGTITATSVTSDGSSAINLLRGGRMVDVLIRQGALSPIELQSLNAYWGARYK